MKISAMTTLTAGADNDVVPVVRDNTNYKMKFSTFLNYIMEKLGSKIGNISGLMWNEAGSSDDVVVNHSGETRKITLDNLSKFVINNVLRNRWCSGTFSCNGASDINVTFPRELYTTPIVVCTPVGNTETNIYSIKVKPGTTTTTGFSVLVLQQQGGTTSRSDSPSLVVNYIAWCPS